MIPPEGVRIVAPDSVPGWDDLVLSHADASVFHSAGWASVLSESYGFRPLYLLKIHGGQIVFAIPLMEIRNPFGMRRGVSLPFSDYCDPLLGEGVSFGDVMPHLLEYGKSAGWRSLEIRCSRLPLKDPEPSATYLHHTLSLCEDADSIYRGLRESTRRNIQKARKGKVEVRFCNTMESVKYYYELHCLTRKEQGLPPQPFSFFTNLHRHLIGRDAGVVLLAFLGDAPVAGAIFLQFGKKAFYKYGASDKKFQELRPNNLVMWEGIQRYSRSGYQSLCFGRTESEHKGLGQYKRGWGSVESSLTYYKYDFGKSGYGAEPAKLERWHTGIFRRMPIPLLKAIGNAIYRYAA